MQLRLVFLAAAVAMQSFAEQPAVYFDGSRKTFDEACLVETLQGLANRKGPNLLVNFPAWDTKIHDGQWVDIYKKHNGIEFRDDIQFIDELLTEFTDYYDGFVVFDSAVDATRYMAITLSGLENLLPVSEGMLEGYSAQFRTKQVWRGIDFSRASLAEVGSAWNAGYRKTEWEQETELLPGKGLAVKNRLSIGNSMPDGTTRGKGVLAYGPVLLDLSAAPVLVAEVPFLENGASFYVQLVTEDGVYTSPVQKQAGCLKWDIAKATKLSGKILFQQIRLIAVGHQSNTCWRAIHFADSDGNIVPTVSPEKTMTELFNKPVKHDFRGRFDDSIEAYQWALKNILPTCNRKFAHTIDGVVDGKTIGSGPWMSFDFAVMNRGFVFNLTFNGDDGPVAFGHHYLPDAKQARMYRKILKGLEQPAFITGYGDSENDWFPLMSEYGHSYLVPQYRNASFHAAVPATGALRQKIHYTPETVELEKDKYYVCFISSDGDTFKGLATQLYQSWNTDKRRGDVPFTFAVPNWMGTYFPAMLEYYYKTATPNDHFAGCGVWSLNTDSPAAKTRLYEWIRKGMEAADFDTLINVTIDPRSVDEFERFADVTDAMGVAQIVWSGIPWGAQELLRNGTMLITNPDWLGYCYRATDNGKWEAPLLGKIYHDKPKWEKAKRAIVDHIEKVAAQHEPPFTILVFPSVHNGDVQYSICAEIADALDKDQFKITRFDEACAAMKKYYEGNHRR